MFHFTIRDLLWLTVLLNAVGLMAQEPGPTLKELLGREADNEFSAPAAVRHHYFYHEKRRQEAGHYFSLVVSLFQVHPTKAYLVRWSA